MCRAPTLCTLIEVDCSIISLITFFHFLRLSLLSSRRTRVAERRPSSPLSSGASHPPHHCWSLSQLLITPLPPLSPSFPFSHCSLPSFPSYLIANRSIHSSSLASLSLSLSSLSEVGKIWNMPVPDISPSFPLSSVSLIRISQMFCDYFYPDLGDIFSPSSAGKSAAFSLFSNQDLEGEYFFKPRIKQLWFLCWLFSCEIEIHRNSGACNMSNGFKRNYCDTVQCFNKNCLCDICDLLIVMVKKKKKKSLYLQNHICGSSPGSILLSCSQSLSPFVSPSSLYPLLLHFSIMETLESFTSLLSIMSFKLFPYFLFLTSLLFLCSTTFPSLTLLILSSSPPPPLGSRSSLSSHIVSCPHHITNSLSQAISLLASLPCTTSSYFLRPRLPHLPRLLSPSCPPSCISSYYSRKS